MSTPNEINTRIKLKRDTEKNWEAASDKTILNGEVILVEGANGRLRAKIGDGTKTYSELEFMDAIYQKELDLLETEFKNAAHISVDESLGGEMGDSENLVPTATTASGAVQGGRGYTDNYRLLLSGQIGAGQGYTYTGHISATVDNVIKLSGGTYDGSLGNYIQAYDENRQLIWVLTLDGVDDIRSGIAYKSGGEIIFTPAQAQSTSLSKMKSIRFSTIGKGAELVVTRSTLCDYTGWLRDRYGSKFVPKTLTSQVFYSDDLDDSTNLQTTLESMNTDIDGSVKSLSISGDTITYTKNDNSTDTITVQNTVDSALSPTSTNPIQNKVVHAIDQKIGPTPVSEQISAASTAMQTSATQYTDQKIADLINGAPTTLDTLGEIATAMRNNKDIVTVLEQAIGNKLDSDHAAVMASQSASGHMSATDKTKLDGIATGANKYTHPTTAGNKHIPSGGSSGQILRWSASGTAVWGNETTYNNATTSAAGLMSATDKTNLNTVIAQLGGYTIKYAANSSSLPSDTKIITLVPRGK